MNNDHERVERVVRQCNFAKNRNQGIVALSVADVEAFIRYMTELNLQQNSEYKGETPPA